VSLKIVATIIYSILFIFFMEYNSCFFSSFFFLTNAIVAYIYEYYFYAMSFLSLTITSIIVHTNYNIYTNIIDKIAIFSIFSYGLFLFVVKVYTNDTFYEHIMSVIIFLTFAATVYLYIYGYYTKSYCFCEDVNVGNLYHSLQHFISSIGHHLLTIL
jgi:hypothetical protein